ncbi:MAG: sialidase family protein [Chloroflexi bacterium]|nr:sialidase family protein [Chloroflexota bacterium]
MSAAHPPQRLADTVNLQDRQVPLAAPPVGLVVRGHLGLITAPAVDGQIVYRTERGTLFETRAIKTPGGDYLLMFPTNNLAAPEGRCHYGRQERKSNDLVAFRSSDRGETWHGPTRPIDIDYNLHGFIPLTPAPETAFPRAASTASAPNPSGLSTPPGAAFTRTPRSAIATPTTTATPGPKSA